MSRKRIHEVLTGIEPANAPLHGRVTSYVALSDMTQSMLEMKRLKDNNADSGSVDASKRGVAQSLLAFINSGDNNEGLRLFNLMVAQLDNPDEVRRALAVDGEDEQRVGGLGDVLEMMDGFVQGTREAHLSMLQDAVASLKQERVYDVLIRTLNHYRLDEQKALMTYCLNQYVAPNKGWLLKRIFNYAMHKVTALMGAHQSGALSALMKNRGGNQYEKVDALRGVQDEDQRNLGIQKTVGDALDLAGRLTGVIHDYINIRNGTRSESLADLKSRFKALLKNSHVARQEGGQTHHYNVLSTLKLIVEAACQEILANNGQGQGHHNPTLIGEILNQHVTDAESRARVQTLVTGLAEQGGPLLVVNTLLSRLTESNQKDAIDELFGYELQWVAGDEVLPEAGRCAVAVKRDAAGCYAVRIFSQRGDYHDYNNLPQGVNDLIRGQRDGGHPAGDQAFIRALTADLGHDLNIGGGEPKVEFMLDALSRLLVGQPHVATERVAADVRPEGQRHEGYQIDKIAGFAKRMLQTYGNQNQLKALMTGRGSNEDRALLLEVVRNLAIQEDFQGAIDDLKDQLPPFLHHNLELMRRHYFLSELSVVGKNIVPHMTDDAILSMLSHVPDDVVALMQTKMESLFQYVGEPGNNLHSALEDRAVQLQLNLRDGLSDANVHEFAASYIFERDEAGFERWLQTNHVVGSRSDHTARMRRRNDADASGVNPQDEVYQRQANLPNRLLDPIRESRRTLLECTAELRGTLLELGLTDAEANSVPVAHLLGTPALAILRGYVSGSDNDILEALNEPIHDDERQRCSDIEHAQSKAVNAYLVLLGDMGVPLDLVNTEVGVQGDGADQDSHIQTALVSLRGMLTRYPLAQGVSQLVNDLVPAGMGPMARGQIDSHDKKIIATKAVDALARADIDSVNGDDLTRDDQIAKIWGFTQSLLAVTNETLILNEYGQITNADGRLVGSDGHLHDSSGRRVDAEGWYVNAQGERLQQDVFGRAPQDDGTVEQRQGLLGRNGAGQRINNNGDLIDFEGRRIDEWGRCINDAGQLVNISGERVDRHGRRLNDQNQVDVTADDYQLPVTDEEGRPSQIIFNVDGSVVDAEGLLHARGSARAQALTARVNRHGRLDLCKQACHALSRQEVRKIIEREFNFVVSMLSDNNTPERLSAFLEDAGLPPSIQNMLQSFVNELLPQDILGSDLSANVLKSVGQYDADLKNKLLSSIPDAALDGLLDQLTQVINFIDPFDEMPFFADFGKTLEASLGEITVIQKLVNTLTQGYYKEIPHCDKRSIATAVLNVGRPQVDEQDELDPESLKALIGAMVQAGGPGFQKAMQLFKSDVTVPAIRKALDEMDDSVHPMDELYVRDQIEENIGNIEGPNGERYRLLTDAEVAEHCNANDKKQLQLLGSATIAQTHFVYVTRQDDADPNNPPVVEKLVAKVRRPQVRHRIVRELERLRSIGAVTNGVDKTLEALQLSILSETDFNREVDLGKLMKGLYTRDRADGSGEESLSVSDMVGAHNTLLLQKFVPGETLVRRWGEISGAKEAQVAVRDALADGIKNNISSMCSTLFDGLPTLGLQRQRANLERVVKDALKSVEEEVRGRAVEGRYVPTSLSSAVDRLVAENIEDVFALGGRASQYIGSVIEAQVKEALELNMPDDQNVIDRAVGTMCNEVMPSMKGKLDIEVLKYEQNVLQEQQSFLEQISDTLKLLVGEFASAAFVGDSRGHVSTALTFDHGEYEELPPLLEQAHNSFVVYKRTGGGYELRYKGGDDSGVVWPSDNPDGFHAGADWDRLQALLQEERDHARTSSGDNLKLESDIANLIRKVTQRNVLFEGEGFIDSDRHGGNLLYNKDKGNITCIDTGAGTIMTRYERLGMITVALGIVSGSSQMVLDGLKTMLPNIFDRADAAQLKQEIHKSINNELMEKEKVQALFTFFLETGVITQNIEQSTFNDLLNAGVDSMEDACLDFSNPERAVENIQRYLEGKGLSLVCTDREGRRVDHSKALKAMMDNQGFSRVMGERGLVDGENSLLLIKSLRKIANVLDSFDINAPEAIIQLNRGSKFVDDQVKKANQWKENAQARLDRYNRHVDALPSREAQGVKKVSANWRAYERIDLGVAYLQGLIGTPAKVKALLYSIPSTSSFLWGGYHLIKGWTTYFLSSNFGSSALGEAEQARWKRESYYSVGRRALRTIGGLAWNVVAPLEQLRRDGYALSGCGMIVAPILRRLPGRLQGVEPRAVTGVIADRYNRLTDFMANSAYNVM